MPFTPTTSPEPVDLFKHTNKVVTSEGPKRQFRIGKKAGAHVFTTVNDSGGRPIQMRIPRAIVGVGPGRDRFACVFANSVTALHRNPRNSCKPPAGDTYPFPFWARNIALTAMMRDPAHSQFVNLELSQGEFPLSNAATATISSTADSNIKLNIQTTQLGLPYRQHQVFFTQYARDFAPADRVPTLPDPVLVQRPKVNTEAWNASCPD